VEIRQTSSAKIGPDAPIAFSLLRPHPFRVDDFPGDPASDAPFRTWDTAQIRRDAEAAKSRGAIGEAEDLQRQAAFLEPLLDREGADRWIYLGEREAADWPHTEILSWMAKDDGRALRILANKTDACLAHVIRLAAEGNSEAATSLARIATKSAQALESIAEKNPELLEPAFAKETTIPVVMSVRSSNVRIRKLAQAVKLGSALNFRLDPGGRTSRDDFTGRIAWKLFCYIEQTRHRARFIFLRSFAARKFGGDVSKMLSSRKCAPTISVGTAQTTVPSAIKGIDWDAMERAALELEFRAKRGRPKQVPTPIPISVPSMAIEEEAALLPDFTADRSIVERWWSVAKRCLIEAYPSSQSPADLDEMSPALAGIVRSPVDKASPSRSRNRILDSLKSKFYSFAGLTRNQAPVKQS